MSDHLLWEIKTEVEIIVTSVNKPYGDYWGKIKRLLQCVKVTQGLKLTLSFDNISIIKWWVETSYAVHEDWMA